MHLAISTGQAPVVIEHYRGVVVEPGGATLEERSDDHDPKPLRQRAESLGGWAGYGLGEVECCDVLGLAEIRRVVQFLQQDQLCAVAGRVARTAFDESEIVGRVSARSWLGDHSAAVQRQREGKLHRQTMQAAVLPDDRTTIDRYDTPRRKDLGKTFSSDIIGGNTVRRH